MTKSPSNTVGVRIRRARGSDAPVLSAIAYASKGHWGYPEAWMAQWRQALTLSTDYIGRHVVYLAEVDDAAVGFYALVGAGLRWELDHLWVLPAFIGRGIGRQLFHHAIGRLNGHAPGAIVGIEAEPNAEPFYLHLGARRVREITRAWQGGPRTLPYLEFSVPAAS